MNRRASTLLAAVAFFASVLPLGAESNGSASPAERSRGGVKEKDSSSRSQTAQALKTLESVTAYLRTLETEAGETSGGNRQTALTRQRLNLEWTRRILESSQADALPGRSDLLSAAALGMMRQAADLGIQLAPDGAKITRQSPVDALTEIINRLGSLPSEEVKAALASLEAVPDPVKGALGDYLSSYLAFDGAARESLEAPDPESRSLRLDRILSARLSLLLAADKLGRAVESNRAGLSLSGSSVDPNPAKPAPFIERSNSGPSQSSPETPGDSGEGPAQPHVRRQPHPQSPGDPVLPADPPVPPVPSPTGGAPKSPETAVPLELASAHSAEEGPTGVSSECQLGFFPAFCIDLRPDENNTYRQFYALQIDVGGHDCYLNNAGGSGMAISTSSGEPAIIPPSARTHCGHEAPDDMVRTEPFGGAAALLDLSGQDKYQTANYSGGNGGGEALGAGFLVDLGSEVDEYAAGREGHVQPTGEGLQQNPFAGGLNGGGAQDGTGFLLDGGGNDRYVVRVTTHYGNVCQPGCAATGTNGGAGGSAGTSLGLLVDGSGDDVYLVADPSEETQTLCPARSHFACTTRGANGGAAGGARAEQHSSGSLIDLGGNDDYSAGAYGVNGGGKSTGSGYLLDTSGNDRYKGTDDGVNGGAGDSGSSSARGYAGRSGFLFDGAGDDLYVAGEFGTNGGGGDSSYLGVPAWMGQAAAGMLVDAEGMDFYDEPDSPGREGLASGRGWDRTVTPKGTGAQIDQNSPSADLEVALADSADPAASGSNLKYSLTVTNKGLAPEHLVHTGEANSSASCEVDQERIVPGRGFPVGPCPSPEVRTGRNLANDVVVTDKLPEQVNLSFVSPACSYSRQDHSVTCRLGDLDKDQQAEAEIVVTPQKPSAGKSQTIVNRVSVASLPDSDRKRPTPDPNPENNRAEESTVVVEGTPVRSVSISDAPSVKEGAAGTQATATFNVSLTGPPSDSVVKVKYRTADRTARASDLDYETAAGKIEFKPGQTDQEVTLPVKTRGDDKDEADEVLAVNIFEPNDAIVDNGHGEGIIVDDDSLPSLSVEDVVVDETDSGIYADFLVSLSAESGRVVSVDYATTDGTATVQDEDYRANDGTLTFAPGQTALPVRIVVSGDHWKEPDETFFVNLANPRNSVLARAQAQGTIRDDRDTESRPAPSEADYQGKRIDPDSYQYEDARRGRGGVFVTGHDADKHAGIPFPEYAPLARAAQRVVRAAVNYVTGGKPAPRMLYVTVPKITPEAANEPLPQTQESWQPPSDWVGAVNEGLSTGAEGKGRGERQALQGASMRGMAKSGFVFDVAASSGPLPPGIGVKDLRSVNFAEYDVVVIGCADAEPNLGCGFSQAELDTLNGRTDDLMNYVNRGGGLVAFDEAGLQNEFGFLPFLRPSTDVLQYESDFRVTDFGRSLGLSDEDVQVNYSHNVFLDDSGFGVVDVDGLGRSVSLATRKLINRQGTVWQADEPLPAAEETDGVLLSRTHDGLPRSSIDPASKAAPVFRGEGFSQGPLQFRPVAKPEAALLSRETMAEAVTQPSAQTQAGMQQQTHQQVQQQAQAQNHAQVQIQAAPDKQQEREARVQVARVEATTGRSPESLTPGRSREHLALARQPVPASTVVLGGIAVSMLSLLGLARPRKQRARGAAIMSPSAARIAARRRHGSVHRRR